VVLVQLEPTVEARVVQQLIPSNNVKEMVTMVLHPEGEEGGATGGGGCGCNAIGDREQEEKIKLLTHPLLVQLLRLNPRL
jgi:hypothetical protein